MGSIRKPESIGKLTKTSVTTLQLPASTVNVGAFQYNTATLSLSTNTLGIGGLDALVSGGAALSSLYYVYHVVSSGNLYLIASLSASGPSGYAQYRVAGSFSTDSAGQVSMVEPVFDGYPGNTGDLALPGATTVNSGANGSFAWGYYTPTNVTGPNYNFAAVTFYQAVWSRIGSVVTVSGQCDTNCTVAGTTTFIGVSLPIAAPNLSSPDCNGAGARDSVITGSYVTSAGMGVSGSTTYKCAVLFFKGQATNLSSYYTFQYIIK